LLRNTKKVAGIIVFCLVALPLWAARVDSIDWAPTRSMTIGGMQIQPGQYQLKAEEGKAELQVIAKGKVVATVPCHWTELPAKASDSQVSTDGDKVTQVQFVGRTSAIQIN
jgi:hypothetical protein